jgi:hypothetical protein
MYPLPPPGVTPLGSLSIVEVWDQYDGPRLFVARNRAGASFIGYWADQDEKSEVWLYVGASARRCEEVRRGSLLRQAFTQPEDDILVEVTLNTATGAFQAWRLMSPAQVSADRLPPEHDRLSLPRQDVEALLRFFVSTEATRGFREFARDPTWQFVDTSAVLSLASFFPSSDEAMVARPPRSAATQPKRQRVRA